MLVEKCNQNNAIKVAAFAVEFATVCSPDVFRSFNAYVNAEKNELFTASELLEGFSIQINTNESAESMSRSQEVHGVVLKNDSGWTLSFKDNILVLQCTDYIGWDESIGFVMSAWAFFISFLEKTAEPLKIKALGLEYLDEFYIKDINTNWVEALFNKDSKYLPGYIFSQSGLWHAHTGFYAGNILNRVRMDCIQNTEKKYLQVVAMQHRLNLPEESDLSLGGDGVLSSVRDVMDRMHSENVELIRDILTLEVLKDINMEAK